MGNNDAFKARLAQRVKAASDKLDKLPVAVAFEVAASLIKKSPVDTGRFRSSWRIAVGAADRTVTTLPTVDALSFGANSIRDMVPGETIYVTNSLPYSRRLEYGHSKQAPHGMVRITLAEAPALLKRALRAIE